MNDNPGSTSAAWQMFEAICDGYNARCGDPRVLAYPIAVTVMPGQALIEQIGPVPWQVPAPKARPS